MFDRLISKEALVILILGGLAFYLKDADMAKLIIGGLIGYLSHEFTSTQTIK